MDTGVAAWRCCHLRAVYIFLPNTTTEHYDSIVLSSGANRGALLRHAKIQVVSTAAKKKVKKQHFFLERKTMYSVAAASVVAVLVIFCLPS